jgi:tetratricopeptide (TPR) repeat protein
MRSGRTVTIVATLLLVVLGAGSVMALHKVDDVRGKEATLEEVLYLPSSKTLKRMSLGYSGLLADIYWTRAVQYFGSKNQQRAMRYDLLDPLLEIATDLDPHLIPAYQTGSILLSQRPPNGAGQPERAVALVEKGIGANPEYWRLYFTLGFIHYLDRHDFKAAEQAFRKGSEVPGALPWMKVMAARMAEHAHDIGTALELWKAVYEMNPDKKVKNAALDHIVSLQADAAIEGLEQRVQAYNRKKGSLPATWSDLIHEGLLFGVPADPTGEPFILKADGTVAVSDRSHFPFLGEAR